MDSYKLCFLLKIIRLKYTTLKYLFIGILVFVVGCKKKVDDSCDKVSDLLKKADATLFSIKDSSKIYIDSAFVFAIDSIDLNTVSLKKIQWKLCWYNFDNSIPASLDSIQKFFERQPETDFKNLQLAYVNNFRGVYISQTTYMLDSSIQSYENALKYLEKTKYREKIADVLINIADCYIRTGDYVEGIARYRRALSVSDSLSIGDKFKFPIYYGLGQAYWMGLQLFDLSDHYYKLAETDLENQTLQDKFHFYNSRGNYYYTIKEYATAIDWFTKAKKLVEPKGYELNVQISNANLGSCYLFLGDLEQAKQLIDESLRFFKRGGYQSVVNHLNVLKAGVEVRDKNFNLANSYFNKFVYGLNEEPDLKLVRYEFMQEYYESVGDFNNAYNYSKLEGALNDSLRSAATRNAIVEIDMRYRQDTSLIRRDYELKSKDASLQKMKSKNWMWRFFALTGFFAVLSLWLFWRRQKDLQQARHLETISKYRLQNIRNRISPHFMFNALNQHIIHEGNELRTNELMELVTLLRKSLQMTERVDVLLADEIDFVKSYLRIESLNMDSDFRYSIDLDDVIPDDWRVPAMIIQIPVENAIKHALKPKSGDKLLIIKVSCTDDDLHINVVDNGKGYEPGVCDISMGTGTGLATLVSTIQILNRKNKKSIQFDIVNLEKEGASGTRVEICIPKDYKY